LLKNSANLVALSTSSARNELSMIQTIIATAMCIIPWGAILSHPSWGGRVGLTVQVFGLLWILYLGLSGQWMKV
jgi:hypothetical protein